MWYKGSTRVGSSLSNNCNARVKVRDSNKHITLLQLITAVNSFMIQAL